MPRLMPGQATGFNAAIQGPGPSALPPKNQEQWDLPTAQGQNSSGVLYPNQTP